MVFVGLFLNLLAFAAIAFTNKRKMIDENQLWPRAAPLLRPQLSSMI
jgi:hypothetical protein